MEILKIVLSVLQVLVSVALILSVIFQSGKSANMAGSIDGIADTFFGKNKARSLDQKLEKATGIVAILFIVLTLSLSLI